MSELPQSWTKTTLGELSEYVTSGSRDWSKYYSVEGALFVRTQDINKNKLRSYDGIARVALPDKAEGKRTRLKKDDLLITITGANVGKCAQVSEEPPEAYVSQSVALVRLNESSLAKYLHRHLLSPITDDMKTWLEENSYGMGRPVLSLENVRSVPIMLAPLAEQTRIADKLDALLSRVDAARERLDRVPMLLKQFRQTVLAAATSGELTEDWRAAHGLSSEQQEVRLGDEAISVPTAWKVEALSAQIDPNRPLCYGVVQPGEEVEGGVLLVRVQDMENGTVMTGELRTVSVSVDGEYRRSRVKEGDLLVSVVGTIGRTAIVPSGIQANIARAIARVAAKSGVESKWLNVWLSSSVVQWWLLSSSKEVARKTLNLSDLAKLPVALPSSEEQVEIVRRVEVLFSIADKVQAQYEAARVHVDKLTPALLAKAFRGELVPQDPNDEPADKLLERLLASKASETKPVKQGHKSPAVQKRRKVS